MSSAKVSIPPPKKQHLEAGRRRLKEYRDKKRKEKAGAVNHSPPADDANVPERHALENGQIRVVESDDAGTSSRVGTAPPDLIDSVEKPHGFASRNGVESTRDAPILSSLVDHDVSISQDLPHTSQSMEERQNNGSLGLMLRTEIMGGHSEQNVDSGMNSWRYEDGLLSNQSTAQSGMRLQDDNVSHNSYSYPGVEKTQLGEASSEIPSISSTPVDSVAENLRAERSGSDWCRSRSESLSSDSIATTSSEVGKNIYGNLKSKKLLVLEEDRKEPSNTTFRSSYPDQNSESLSNRITFDSEPSTSDYHVQLTAFETQPRRSRPSFLDSLNISRTPASSDFLRIRAQDSESNDSFFKHDVASSEKPSMEMGTMQSYPNKAASNPHGNSVASASWNQKTFENYGDQNLESQSKKQNEDFAALEQHIDDLTQEKFSLQRALESSLALSESLAAENSSLTKTYNQQGGVVNQLKYELEILQEEIKALLAELESIKMQYKNVQLECNAADERAKLLASEVIGLEEKALRLRSNELKLEKDLEKAHAKIAACKKKLSSLEKERRDLHQTIDAMQEEKKLLQNKFRKASVSGISAHISQGNSKKDMSTSTDDIGTNMSSQYGENAQSSQATSRDELHEAAALSSDGANALSLTENGLFHLEVASTVIPPEQKHMIENIHSLISELIAEKEELMKALVTETTVRAKMKDLNKEISQKLEAQTQRLELLTAQTMAHENIPAIQPSDSRVMQDIVPYADEGDEVVERMLGWIMKLFPGGPSRRRTSKLL